MKTRPHGWVTRQAARALLGLASILLFAIVLPAASVRGSAPGIEFAAGTRAQLRWSGTSSATRVGPPPASRRAQQATFVVNYDSGFMANPSARAAFQYAVDIWSAQLSSPTPIVIDAHWEPLDPGVLGEASEVTDVRNFPGAPSSNTWYPIALANRLAGTDLDPANADVDAHFSSTMPWYFGTDGHTPAGQMDFVSVVLHELGHGLGFAGVGQISSGLGYYAFGSPSSPLAYDRFVVNGLGVQLLSFQNGSVALASQLTSSSLYFGGAHAIVANGGVLPRLYAPPVWEQGSSYSHLDEATYLPGDPNSLMTPALDDGESVHDPGPIVRGVFADMGWSISSAPAATSTPTPSATATAPPSATATAPPSATATPTPTATSSATPTRTPSAAPGRRPSSGFEVVVPILVRADSP